MNKLVILAAIIYGLFQFYKFMKAVGQKMQGGPHPEKPQFPRPTITGESSIPNVGNKPGFDELLREIKARNARPNQQTSEMESEVETIPRKILTPDDDNFNKAQTLYREIDLSQKNREPKKVEPLAKTVFEEYKLPTQSRNTFAEALHNRDEVRKAFVLSEILKRKYN